MNEKTTMILSLADVLFKGGRDEFLKDLVPLIDNKVFFSNSDLAARYHVSPNTIMLWRRVGLIEPSFKVPGGTARYTLGDIIEFEQRQKQYKTIETGETINESLA